MDFSSHLLAISGALALLLLYKLWRRRSDYRHNIGGLLPPEPWGNLPILGHLHLLGAEKTLARTFAAMADKYGPIFTIWLGVHRTVVISDCEAIKECFTTNDKVLASRPKSSHGTYLSYNYAAFGFASYGTYWRDVRKIVVVQLLSNHRLKSLRNVQVSEVNNLIKEVYLVCSNRSINEDHHLQAAGSTKVVVMSEWLERLTLNMITRMIAGKRCFSSMSGEAKAGEGKRIGKLMKEYMYISGVFVPSDLIPALGWMNVFPGPVRTMKRLSRELDSVLQGWIEEHKLKRMKNKSPEDESLRPEDESLRQEDFIDVMLSVIENDYMLGHSRETIIKATAMTLIIAGADTTSIALTWILSNLLNNRRALELAQEELDQKVGRERWAEDSDLGNLVYLQAVIKETLRLFPPGPVSVPHEATQDCSIAGYHIPKGTRLMVNLWKLHRDPKIWRNPDEFMPERFLTDQTNVDVTGQNFELIPFGSGRRSCPGMTFALQVLHLTLARLLQGFNMTTPMNLPVDMTEGLSITLPKTTPLEVQITPRLPSELYETL